MIQRINILNGQAMQVVEDEEGLNWVSHEEYATDIASTKRLYGNARTSTISITKLLKKRK